MNRRVSKLLAVLLSVLGSVVLTGCTETPPDVTSRQGFAGLGLDSEGFAEVEPGGVLTFPEDHGSHPDFRIEWWYVTANLTDQSGQQFGVQWTLFRQALATDADRSGWQDGQVWMAHAAITTAESHYHAERFGRSGGGQAGVSLSPHYEAWLDDWSLQQITPPGAVSGTTDADPLSHLRLRAGTSGFSYDLVFQTDQDLVLQGQNGYSVKSDRGQASWYFSQPFYQVNGRVRLTKEGEYRDVRGTGWLDREWSSQPLAPEQVGWDWFSLQLDSGARVMLFRLREQDEPDSFFAGTWITESGETTALTPDQIDMQPLATHSVAGRDVPVRWQLSVPQFGLDISVGALNPDAWMGGTIPYWEGPIEFVGSHAGVGYLEMTGY